MEAIREISDEEFSRLWETAKRVDDIAAQCDLTYDRTVEKARRLGLPPRQRSRIKNQVDVPLLFELWNKNVEARVIAQRLGVRETYITKLASRFKLPKRLPKKAENHGMSVSDPTPEEIAERAAEVRARRPVVEDDGTVEIRCYCFDARHAVYTEGSLWVA
jgi:transposase